MSKEEETSRRMETGIEGGEIRKEGSISRIEGKEMIQEEGLSLRGIIGMIIKIQEIFEEKGGHTREDIGEMIQEGVIGVRVEEEVVREEIIGKMVIEASLGKEVMKEVRKS